MRGPSRFSAVPLLIIPPTAPAGKALHKGTSVDFSCCFSEFIFAGWGILLISSWQAIEKVRNAMIVSVARAIIFPICFIHLLPAMFGAEAGSIG